MAPFVTLAFSTFVVVATALAPRHEGHDHGNDNGHASSGTATAVPTVTTPTTSPAPQVSECYSTYSYTGVLGTSISDFAGHESLVELLASYTASGDDVVDTYTTFDAEAGEYLYGKVWKNQLIAHGVTEFTTATTVLTIPCETSSPASEETSDAEPEKSTEPTNSAEDTSAPTETEGYV